MSNHGYFKAAGQVFGPCTPKELQQLAAEGTIKRSTLIRRGEDGEWVEAGNVKGMFPTETAETPKPQSPVAAETNTPKVEPQPLTVHQAAVNGTPSPPSPFRLIKAALLLPFIPIGFWGQTKRWKLYWAEEPKGPIFVAKRTDTAKHQLEPSLIEYFQSPRRRHKKILSVTATIQTASGDSRRTIEMSNRMIPGPEGVLTAFFYPGLHTYHLAELGYVKLGDRTRECESEKHAGMSMSQISNILPMISRMAKSQADRDIAHYNRITDFGDDFSGLRDVFGNYKSEICFVGADFIEHDRETYSPGYDCRSETKRAYDKIRGKKATPKAD